MRTKNKKNTPQSNDLIGGFQTSQSVNIPFAVMTVGSVFIHPFVAGILFLGLVYRVLNTMCREYRLYERTMEEKTGILSTETQEIQYYRIKSIMVEEPFWLRIFGLSNVRIITSEQYKPVFILYGVPDGEEIKTVLSETAYQWRKELGIKEHDLF